MKKVVLTLEFPDAGVEEVIREVDEMLSMSGLSVSYYGTSLEPMTEEEIDEAVKIGALPDDFEEIEG